MVNFQIGRTVKLVRNESMMSQHGRDTQAAREQDYLEEVSQTDHERLVAKGRFLKSVGIWGHASFTFQSPLLMIMTYFKPVLAVSLQGKAKLPTIVWLKIALNSVYLLSHYQI